MERDQLAALTPEAPPIPLEPCLAEAVQGDEVLENLARWTVIAASALRAALRRGADQAGNLPGQLRRNALQAAGLSVSGGDALHGFGIGVLDAPVESGWVRGFPVVDGLVFGLAIYETATRLDEPQKDEPQKDGTLKDGGGRLGELPIDAAPFLLPALRAPLDYARHFHPASGRAAALLEIDGADRILTAGHVFDADHLGAEVEHVCPARPGRRCRGALVMKRGGASDFALIRPGCARCADQWVKSGQGLAARKAPAAIGLRVERQGCDSEDGQGGRILQALHAPEDLLRGRRARGFLFEQGGAPGDSGAAITTRDRDGAPVLSGMYLGEALIGAGPGRSIARGHAAALDALLHEPLLHEQGARLRAGVMNRSGPWSLRALRPPHS